MENRSCGFNCTLCTGVFCERMMETCAGCGGEFQAGLMWTHGDKHYCNRCHREVEEMREEGMTYRKSYLHHGRERVRKNYEYAESGSGNDVLY